MIANTAAGVAHLCSWDYLTRSFLWATKYYRRGRNIYKPWLDLTYVREFQTEEDIFNDPLFVIVQN